jgi:uncharacterized membrane protein
MSRWYVKALLVASLVLNLSLGWMLIGNLRPVPGSGALRSAAPWAALQRLGEQMPAPDRKLFREALMSRATSVRAAQSRYEQQTARVLELMAADRLDVQALAAEIAAARASRQQATDELVAAVLETLPRISVDTRRQLAAHGAPRVAR